MRVRPKIFVTQPIPDRALERLREVAEVELNPDSAHIITKPELIAAVTPHLGSAAFDTRETISGIVVDNILAVIAGRRPPNLYNPEIYGS